MTKHTDTSRSDDLVEWLRDWLTVCSDGEIVVEPICEEIADRLEALEAENERLRGALREISETPNAGWMIARAALGDTQ